jgi:hypothetical protein
MFESWLNKFDRDIMNEHFIERQSRLNSDWEVFVVEALVNGVQSQSQVLLVLHGEVAELTVRPAGSGSEEPIVAVQLSVDVTLQKDFDVAFELGLGNLFV